MLPSFFKLRKTTKLGIERVITDQTMLYKGGGGWEGKLNNRLWGVFQGGKVGPQIGNC